jgi:hypothetical protein
MRSLAAGIGIFCLLQAYVAFEAVRKLVSPENARPLLWLFLVFCLGALVLVLMAVLLGYIPFLTARLLALVTLLGHVFSAPLIARARSLAQPRTSPLSRV